jgi:hypothetical protein
MQLLGQPSATLNVCVRACVRACVRVCLCACACMRACVQATLEGALDPAVRLVVLLTAFLSVPFFAVPAAMLTWGFEGEAAMLVAQEQERQKRR